MKHINRSFKQFLNESHQESHEDIKSDISLILSELEDKSIPVSIVKNHTYHTFLPDSVKCLYVITLGEKLVKRSINLKEFLDDILRLFDYLERKDFQFSSLIYGKSDASGKISHYSLQITDIGLGQQAMSDELVNGIGETNYLKLVFKKQ